MSKNYWEDMYAEVVSRSGRLLLRGEVESISRFGVVQDYTLHLTGGQTILIDQKTIQAITAEWNRTHPEEGKDE